MNTVLNETPNNITPPWKIIAVPIALVLVVLAGNEILERIFATHNDRYVVYVDIVIALSFITIGLAVVEFARYKSNYTLRSEQASMARMIIFLLPILFICTIHLLEGSYHDRWADRIAIEAATYAQEHFEAIDRNRDGNLLVGEIDHFNSTATLTAKEREKVTFLTSDINKMGHILEQHYHGRQHVTTYAINKADLDIYIADYQPRSTSNTRH